MKYTIHDSILTAQEGDVVGSFDCGLLLFHGSENYNDNDNDNDNDGFKVEIMEVTTPYSWALKLFEMTDGINELNVRGRNWGQFLEFIFRYFYTF